MDKNRDGMLKDDDKVQAEPNSGGMLARSGFRGGNPLRPNAPAAQARGQTPQDFINLEDDYDGDGDVEFDEFVQGAYMNPALAVPLAFT